MIEQTKFDDEVGIEAYYDLLTTFRNDHDESRTNLLDAMKTEVPKFKVYQMPAELKEKQIGSLEILLGPMPPIPHVDKLKIVEQLPKFEGKEKD